MRSDSVVMIILIGLALGDSVNRVFAEGTYRNRLAGNGYWDRGRSRITGWSDEEARQRRANYLEKLVTEYGIIPLMSKLI